MKITTKQIQHYLSGQCSAEEAKRVEEYIASNPDFLNTLFPEEEWSTTSNIDSYNNEDTVFEKAKSEINSIGRIRRMYKLSLGVAAALFIITGISLLYFNYSSQPKELIVSKKTAKTEVDTEIPNLYYINSDNKNMFISVSDGSTITLYPGSEVRFAEDFNLLKERNIQLKGKAKFEVAKDKHKPFKVHSQGMITTALGTVFIVDELQNSETNVSLLEGSIEVKTSSPTIQSIIRTIKPRESLKLNHQLGTILEEVKVNDSNVGRDGYYTENNNRLSIKNLSLKDIINNLEQNYKIVIQYDSNSLKDKYYSGSFDVEPHVYQKIIKEINYLHNTQLRIK